MSNRDYSCYSDSHKDAYGFRPSLKHLSEIDKLSDEEYRDLIEKQNEDVRRSIAEDDALCDVSEKNFLNQLREIPAPNLRDALRWLMEAEGEDINNPLSVECFEYEYNLRHGFIANLLND